MLPTGTALAATPPPVPASAADAPAAEPTPEPSGTTDPAPQPTPTTEPSPDPSTTTEPTADPTPDPTTPPCAPLALAALDAPGQAVGSVTLDPNGTACFSVTVEKPGLHRILVSGQYAYPSLYSGESKVACEDIQYRDAWCELAAGTYTLKLSNTYWAAQEARVSLVPLMAAPGCPAVEGTGYDTAPTTGRATDRMGLVCHSFTAAPGDRVTTAFRLTGSGETDTWVTDGTGRNVCPSWNADGSDGCVLPEGVGGYRVLTEIRRSDSGFPAAYSLKVRRLSHPAGCVTAPVNTYGSAPTEAAPQTECRTFTPSVTSRYDVRTVNTAAETEGIEVYAPDGTTACANGADCALTAGVPYTLVTNQAVRVLDRASTEGCTDDVTLAITYRGTFGTPGSVQCLDLPVPQGAHLALLDDRAASVTVVDAAGKSFCGSGLTDGTCVLGGTAPYRLLVSRMDPHGTATGYGLLALRTDVPGTCRTFVAGDFTANTARMTLRTGEGVFADCLTIPADDHSAREITQIQKVSGTSVAQVSVLDATGKQVCTLGTSYNSWTTCALTPGVAHTVLVQSRDVPAEFALTRRDVTATARGCLTTPATAVGGPSTGGVPAAPGTFLCHEVTTPDARDTLHLNARDTLGTTRLAVYNPAGDALCGYFTAGCAVSGSARYQAVVVVREGETPAPVYRLDALRIATAAGPAPECVKVPNVSYGFGPLTGTLSEQKTAICAVLPTGAGDSFDLKLAPSGDFAQMPTPWLYRGSPLTNGCSGRFGSEGQTYTCALPYESTREARPTTLVIGLPENPAQPSTALSAQFTCTRNLCGPDEHVVSSAGPATVAQGKITMTIGGTALHEQDQVFVTPATGGFSARSTTVSVAADRRSKTVALDLTNAPLGPLNLTVYTYHGYEYFQGTVTVVAPIRNTAVPTLSGTAVVGGTVTAKPGSWSVPADSYAYEWRANGVAVAGATGSTYTPPATLLGKQLSVAVTTRKAGHPVVTAVSAAVVVKGVAPKPTKVPYISGATRVGSKVTAVVGTWAPAPTSYAYQWRANGVAIPGATSSSYVPAASVLGKKLTVTVTALRTGHLSGAYTTAGYTVAVGLAPKATVAPYVTGTVRVGRTLTLNRGTWAPAPTSFAYQWYANGRAISGATKTTFVPTKAQRGLRITVRVTAYRTGHTAGVAWTRSTAAVAG
ncbi:hypothetical protein ABTX77_20195 [Streptomyces sp. NPDC097704]|uniref:hypothetical protein n=1 Tax=Streptomyces sp. NPDC097704 TaxID=3157101 RepID=UPI00331E3878